MNKSPSNEVTAAADARRESDPAPVGNDGYPMEDPATQSQRAYITLLFNKYRSSLYRYLTRLVHSDDAAELVQETYFRLLRHGETVQLEALARAFLFQTATNLARDHRRRSASHKASHHIPLDEEEIVADQPGPESDLAQGQIRELLERAIAELPYDTRTVFLLHRYRDLTYPQISQVMQLSPRTVARKMAEALERISAAVGRSL